MEISDINGPYIFTIVSNLLLKNFSNFVDESPNTKFISLATSGKAKILSQVIFYKVFLIIKNLDIKCNISILFYDLLYEFCEIFGRKLWIPKIVLENMELTLRIPCDYKLQIDLTKARNSINLDLASKNDDTNSFTKSKKRSYPDAKTLREIIESERSKNMELKKWLMDSVNEDKNSSLTTINWKSSTYIMENVN